MHNIKNFVTKFSKLSNLNSNLFSYCIQNEKLKIVPLNHQSNQDYQTFKHIIANASVAFTSSWMKKCFEGAIDFKKYAYIEYIKSTKKGHFASSEEFFNGEINRDIYDHFIHQTFISFFNEKENDIKLKEMFTELTKYNQSEELGYCAIYDNSNNVIGGCGLSPYDNGNAEISIHIPTQKAQGIGKMVFSELLQYGFDIRNLKAISATYLDGHKASAALCNKHGFETIPSENDDTIQRKLKQKVYHEYREQKQNNTMYSKLNSVNSII